MPISRLGVLYLENSQVLQAFPAKRLEILTLLCAQAAITIENAQMYRSMEEAKQAAEAATLMKSTCMSSSFLSNISFGEYEP
jgi:osomolarity two-component system, sensor histidine kinase CHK1